MRALYLWCMDVLHRCCMLIAGTCLVVITLIIPWGVFTRYVLNAAASWPEPAAVLLMIWFSFMAAALCYRENLHIGVAEPLAGKHFYGMSQDHGPLRVRLVRLGDLHELSPSRNPPVEGVWLIGRARPSTWLS